MCPKVSTKFYLLFLLAITVVNINKAFKCGEYFCDEKSECIHDDKSLTGLTCVCSKGYLENISGKSVHCHRPEVSNDFKECVNVGDPCATNHVCNSELACEEHLEENAVEVVHSPGLVCPSKARMCSEKCCRENEICQDNATCIATEAILHMDCPESRRCLAHCCHEYEACSEEGKCAAKDTLAIVSTNATAMCAQSQTCESQCCALNETCAHGSQCVLRDTNLAQVLAQNCSKDQLCGGVCCAENEDCLGEGKCVRKEHSTASLLCPAAQRCQDICCAANEECINEKECVAMEKCPAALQCQDKCCSENEKCVDGNRCAAMRTECPACLLNQTCDADNLCVDAVGCAPQYEKCGDMCCPVNETCNENNECVEYIEATTVDNCPQNRKCRQRCCRLHEICNDFNECVKEHLANVSNSSDIIDAHANYETATNNNFVPATLIYRLEGIKENLSCPSDKLPCQQKCCIENQICSSAGECVDKTSDIDCGVEPNCRENAKVAEQQSVAVAYTMIGLGCLILVLSLGLFKLHRLRRTSGSVV